MNQKNNILPNCRECPKRLFELITLTKSNFCATRYMGLCHGPEVILQPVFKNVPAADDFPVINKANVHYVSFQPPDNCPVLEELRAKALLPWPIASVDFLNRRNPDYGKMIYHIVRD